MPGLAGLITRMPRSEAELQLQAMLNAISHEDFYARGTWIDESLGVYVGWTAIKGSFADAMPLHTNRRDTYLIFSGEEYSDGRGAGISRSASSSKESDYLVQGLEQNDAFIESLNGMFHGLIADRNRGEVMIFNDRYGMHRLCYHEAKDAFYFGAEAKAILAARPELAQVNYKSLGEFASLSCILENRTIFKDINVVPAASIW